MTEETRDVAILPSREQVYISEGSKEVELHKFGQDHIIEYLTSNGYKKTDIKIFNNMSTFAEHIIDNYGKKSEGYISLVPELEKTLDEVRELHKKIPGKGTKKEISVLEGLLNKL